AVFPSRDRTDGGLLCLLVDVAGHGQPAAAVVADVIQLLQDPLCENQRPSALLQILNGMLQQTFAATCRFVAALAVLVDAKGNRTASNAGQPQPWIGQSGKTWQPGAVPGGTFQGVAQPDEVYQEGTVALQVAFTDGVSEAGAGRSDRQQFAGRLQGFLDALP